MITTIIDQRAKNRLEIRNLILATARELFIHEGFESFSLRRLAVQIGYSPAAIYNHFKSKGSIFECLAEESFAALQAAAEEIKPIAGEEPLDRLRRGLWGYVNFGLKNPDHYRFAFLIHTSVSTNRRNPRAAYLGLQRRLEACIEAGQIPNGDIDLLAQSLWAAVHGVTSLLIQRPEFPWAGRRKLITQVIDGALKGIVTHNK